MKFVLGLIVGLVVLMLVTGGIELATHMYLFPPPGAETAGTGFLDRMMAAYENLKAADERLIATMPVGALAMVVVAWFAGAFAGAWVANRIAGSSTPGWIIALLTVAFGVYTMMTIPHPAWMWGTGIVLPLIAGWLAQRLNRVTV